MIVKNFMPGACQDSRATVLGNTKHSTKFTFDIIMPVCFRTPLEPTLSGGCGGELKGMHPPMVVVHIGLPGPNGRH